MSLTCSSVPLCCLYLQATSSLLAREHSFDPWRVQCFSSGDHGDCCTHRLGDCQQEHHVFHAWTDPCLCPVDNVHRLLSAVHCSCCFLFNSRVARIPEGSTVLPAICTEEVITLGAELEDGTVLRGQNNISHPHQEDRQDSGGGGWIER